ncbi:UDP-glucose dehydrogenase family protein [Massilia sp. LXY-6]|uniref:UDP-glucose dehydrogenase family protein n=1 Tax=Massilia sp. LXY-6 TaxID=3379823 RepID=UPI003EE2FE6D
MKITVVGTGYVGLVTGACLAEVGNQVYCLDIDQKKIDMLNASHIPIYEPGLENIVRRNMVAGRLQFGSDIAGAVAFGDVQFIAVGTPPDEDGSADLQHVLAAARSIGAHMDSYKVIVNKSTVPVGTAEKVRKTVAQELEKRKVSLTFGVLSNPEFLKEGTAIEDFMRPDRIIIGVDDDYAAKTMRHLYQPFQRNHERMIVMDVQSAELTKYAANAMLATRISFMNELANLAEKLGVDIEQVRQGMGSDPRIGHHFLYPGCGYGGSCFPKDVRALRKTAAEHDSPMLVIDAVQAANGAQKQVLVEKLQSHFRRSLAGMNFAMWGLSFKPNTDDMREAPSIAVITGLLSKGASIQAFDPIAIDEARKIFPNSPGIQFGTDMYEVLEGADALIIVTEWKEFRSPDFDQMKRTLKAPVIFDGRNLYEPKWLLEKGFDYYSVGRPHGTDAAVSKSSLNMGAM